MDPLMAHAMIKAAEIRAQSELKLQDTNLAHANLQHEAMMAESAQEDQERMAMALDSRIERQQQHESMMKQAELRKLELQA